MAKLIKKIFVIIIACCLQGLIIINWVFMFYFSRHFMWGTMINGKDVSGYTVEEAKALLTDGGENYQLLLIERFGKTEEISGEQIGFTYQVVEELKELKEKQDSMFWPLMGFMDRQFEVTIVSQYDEKLLDEQINALSCVDKGKMIAPEEAYLTYSNGCYEVMEGAKGTLLDEEILKAGIKEAINAEAEKLDIETLGCYKESEVTTSQALLVCTAHHLEEYLQQQITYEFGENRESITKEQLYSWLIFVDKENDEVKEKLPETVSFAMLQQKDIGIDEEAVTKYINELADQYDTLGKNRQFMTTKGNLVEVPAGDYGWQMDREQEVKELLKILKLKEKQVSRKPMYKHEGYYWGSNDIGKSYVEVDLTAQHLWFYKEGRLVVEGDIVSGTGTNSHATPAGIYNIDYKQKKAILRGPGYACPVSYWMPFYNGMGIHDATWRGSFGGNIYRYDGSHGCINTPLSLAGTIYEEIEKGMPVICYH